MEDKTKQKFTIAYTQSFLEDIEETLNYIKYHLKNIKAANALMNEVENAILTRSEYANAFKQISTKTKTDYPYYSIKLRNFYVLYVVIPHNESPIMEVRNFVYARRNVIN